MKSHIAGGKGTRQSNKKAPGEHSQHPALFAIGNTIRYAFTSPSGEISVKVTVPAVLRLCGVPR
jgi:hypothetical protein